MPCDDDDEKNTSCVYSFTLACVDKTLRPSSIGITFPAQLSSIPVHSVQPKLMQVDHARVGPVQSNPNPNPNANPNTPHPFPCYCTHVQEERLYHHMPYTLHFASALTCSLSLPSHPRPVSKTTFSHSTRLKSSPVPSPSTHITNNKFVSTTC